LQPNRIPLSTGRKIWEFPAQVLSIGGLRLPATGGFYFRALPYWMSAAALRQYQAKGYAGMVYLHPYDLDAHTPVLGKWGKYRMMRYTGLKGAEKKFRRLVSEFNFCSIVEKKRLSEDK